MLALLISTTTLFKPKCWPRRWSKEHKGEEKQAFLSCIERKEEMR
jgi:hypothetical protein